MNIYTFWQKYKNTFINIVIVAVILSVLYNIHLSRIQENEVQASEAFSQALATIEDNEESLTEKMQDVLEFFKDTKAADKAKLVLSKLYHKAEDDAKAIEILQTIKPTSDEYQFALFNLYNLGVDIDMSELTAEFQDLLNALNGEEYTEHFLLNYNKITPVEK